MEALRNDFQSAMLFGVFGHPNVTIFSNPGHELLQLRHHGTVAVKLFVRRISLLLYREIGVGVLHHRLHGDGALELHEHRCFHDREWNTGGP